MKTLKHIPPTPFKGGFFTSLLALCLSMGISQNANADLKDGLVAHWSFDDCRATDNSGNGHDGTVNGKPECVEGIKGKAFSFDGVDDFISVPSTPSLNPVNQLTMSFWIRVDDFSNLWSAIIHKGSTNPNCFENREYALWLQNESYLHQTSAGDGSCQNYLNSTTVIEKGKWLHYVGVVDRVKHVMSIYINGTLNTTQTDNYNSFNNNNYDLRIGLSEEAQWWESPFKGTLEDLRIYNRALTEAEVMELYNGVEPQTGIVDLSVAITKPAAVSANKKATYKLTITNNSEFTATGVKAYFVVPGKTLVTVDVPKNCTASGRIIECSLPDLEAKKNATQSFSMKIFKKGALNVGAGVSANEDDTNEDNNEKSAVILVK